MTYLVNELIHTIKELRPFSNDEGLDIIYVETEYGLYPIEEISLNEDRQIVLKL